MKILKLLVHPVVLAILGLTLLGLLIWFFGPLLAFGSLRPLESPTARWVLIALITAVWLVRRIWRWSAARRTNASLMDGLVRGAAPVPPTPSASEQEVAQLRTRFEEAIANLRQVRLSGAGRRPGLRDLLSLSGRQYLYQLPWYIFIGAPGSGKTTALVNCGLQFPLAEKFGTAGIRGVGGTRNCDWWFTDEAVLLDTAGRYTTQESDQATDSAVWKGFLDLLHKARPRRPINGVILTVSAAELLQQSADERETQARAMRARLQELHERFQIRFPIYVLVTKCDLLAGFSEFFDSLGKEERAQVWGATFAYKDDPAATPLAGFAAEFDALEQRLLDRVLDRMQAERDPQRRALIFAFPQQIGNLKPLLTECLERVFAASKFEEAPMIRGVYFTSGTQEGSPIDRVMGNLARAFGVERRLLAPQVASGRSYFLTHLLHRVIFPEQTLAGTNLRLERRTNLLRLGAYGLAGLVLVVACAVWLTSYARNKAYVAETGERVAAVQAQVNGIPAGNRTDVVGLLPILAEVRDLGSASRFPDGEIPTSMGFGLFQGDKLAAASDQAYRRLLVDAFMPRLALRIEEQLRSASAANLEFAYEALKAYLMVYDPSHFDADALKGWITFDWQRSLPRDVTEDQRQALAGHLDALLERGAVTSPVPSDGALIQSVRTLLAQYPLADRVYSRLKREGVGAAIPDFSLIKAAGPAAPLVFTRVSGKPLSQGIPGLFTYDGYYKAFKKESDRVANQLAGEEAWVMGEKDGGSFKRYADPIARARLIDDVRRLYLNDYARIWEAYLSDIKVRRSDNLQESIEIARILSAPDNPLVPFMVAASHETTLLKQEGDKTVVDKTVDRIKGTRQALGVLFDNESAPIPTVSPGAIESIVDNRFEKLRRAVTPRAPGQPAPIDAAIALIADLHTMLNAADTALKAKTAPPPSDVPLKIKALGPSLPDPLGTMLQGLAVSGARQAGGAIVANLRDAIDKQVGEFCRQAIEGRYPFVSSSSRDVTQDDFATLFAPGGKMDAFFQTNLASLVDTSVRPWTFKPINDVQLPSPAALAQFQRAQVIRDVFFRSGRSLGMRLEFTPVEMDISIAQFILDVDGQLVKYAHGPQVPQSVQWPGPRGSTQVRVQIQPPGPNGVSGTTTSGPWALFRMFDKLQIPTVNAPERFHVIFLVDGRRTEFDVVTSSVQNPFHLKELEQFQCP
jgi:type VI secretion system protein ImpL